MKRGVLLSILFLMLAGGLWAQQGWQDDAERGDRYFWAKDYDAAWLFYERALARGCDDGIIVFRAAESFRRQGLTEDPEYQAALYAVAHHFLLEQYPDDSALSITERYFDTSTVVNRRFLRRVYRDVDGQVPKPRFMTRGIGEATGFFAQRFGEIRQLFSVAFSDGVKAALSWARPRAWRLISTWLMINFLSGIVLPVVMAVAVSREGRKSYVTAYAFLLHWGLFGIHRFYLGRWISGVIWLCTGGLLGIGVFFDVFLTGAYVRFWNEDHRDERPHSPGSRRERTPKPPRPAKTKSTRSRPPKKSRPPREKKVRKEPQKSADRRGKVEPAEEFSFNDSEFDTAPAAAAAGVVAAAMDSSADADDEFDDLPDLNFDSTDEESGGDSDQDELPGNFNEDDFNIEDFE